MNAECFLHQHFRFFNQIVEHILIVVAVEVAEYFEIKKHEELLHAELIHVVVEDKQQFINLRNVLLTAILFAETFFKTFGIKEATQEKSSIVHSQL